MLKKIIINNQETNYAINEEGQCYNLKTQKFLLGTVKNTGYKMVLLTLPDGKRSFSIHRLVAEAFLPNTENKPYVNHKDGNKLNNHVSNLEWVTSSENHYHAIQNGLCSLRGSQEKYLQDFDNEEWKQFKDTDYYVSNLGRLKNIKTNNILKGSIQQNGYVKCSLRINNQTKNYLLHNLVFFSFYPQNLQKNFVINHKDGNKQNNCLQNLEYISVQNNVLHRKYQLQSKSIKGCFQYDLNDNLIQSYPSMSQAAKTLNINVSGISQACNNKIKTYKGYKWKLI